MYTVMVTGGLGSGKSTLVEELRALGADTIDLDEVNRGLLATNDHLKAELAERFGDGILDSDGEIVTRELAARAFADAESTRDLGAISFPYITNVATEHILNLHCAPLTQAKVLVVEVPLLTEVPDFAQLADEVIAVVADEDLRLARAIARGMDPKDARSRMQMQPGDDERRAIADTICVNNASPETLRAWARDWWADRAARLLD